MSDTKNADTDSTIDTPTAHPPEDGRGWSAATGIRLHGRDLTG
jgi:hypothetical protein